MKKNRFALAGVAAAAAAVIIGGYAVLEPPAGNQNLSGTIAPVPPHEARRERAEAPHGRPRSTGIAARAVTLRSSATF